MSVKIKGTYRSGKKVDLEHGPSGARFTTAAPIDNQGDGSSFSPTDLVAAALGACMLTVMGIVAERDGLVLEGAWFEVEKIMGGPPRRIDRLPIVLHMPKHLGEQDRAKLERSALTCPVHHSLRGDIEAAPKFAYDV